MNITQEEIEIMAPVGSYESLMAAIQGGAGSVYFGIEQLNMRSKSSNNFTTEDLKKIVSICNEHNVKTYLTVNTVIYNDDIETMYSIVNSAKEYSVSAIIASDMAVIDYAHSIGVEVHISTQLNISNYLSLQYYSKYADVIVLARELKLTQVKEIYDKIRENNITGPKGELVQIEMFVHGALCMAISGKCYLSLHEKNHSANRGACLQTCRKGYTVTENESGNQLLVDNEYIMSPKDLCTIEFVDELIESGVRVFKIEGRARSAEYVKTVVSTYKNAIKDYCNGDFTPEKGAAYKESLKAVFNRGFWDGYYLGQKLGDWSKNYGSKATKRKIYVGKGTNYFPKIGVAEFLMETGELKCGDEILITGPTTGVYESTVKEIRVDLNTVDSTQKGERFSMPVDVKIRRSDKLFKIVDASEVKQQ